MSRFTLWTDNGIACRAFRASAIARLNFNGGKMLRARIITCFFDERR